jgi:DNA-directed RNA polymerase specialized sigma24 family protein
MDKVAPRQQRRNPDEYHPLEATVTALGRELRDKTFSIYYINYGRLMRMKVGQSPDDGADLFQSAILRIWDGSRRWPRDIPFAVFFVETMRSILSAERTARREIVADDWSNVPGPDDLESNTHYRQMLAQLEDSLRNDKQLLAFHRYKLWELAMEEIRARMNLEPSDAEALRRRYRRHVADWAARRDRPNKDK